MMRKMKKKNMHLINICDYLLSLPFSLSFFFFLSLSLSGPVSLPSLPPSPPFPPPPTPLRQCMTVASE